MRRSTNLPTAETAAHNARVLAETILDESVSLPPMFIVHKTPTIGVLVHAIRAASNPNVWHLTMNMDTSFYLQGCIPRTWVHDPYFNGLEPTIIAERASSRTHEHLKYYRTKIKFMNRGVESLSRTRIPMMSLETPHVVLPSMFYKLFDAENVGFRFECIVDQPIVCGISPNRVHEAYAEAERAAEELIARSIAASAPQPPVAAKPRTRVLPQHLVNCYIEAAIARKEQCPVTMVDLAKESTVVTPCGHALDKSVVGYWLSSAHSCPVCRRPCTEEDLQVWEV